MAEETRAYDEPSGERFVFMADGITKRCRVRYTETNEQCVWEARVKVTYGCRHEHIGESLLCIDCADQLEEHTVKGEFFCEYCRILGHFCLHTIIKREPINPESEEEDVLIG